jgi:hypothetical protein
MKHSILFFSVLCILLIAGCKKNKYTTEPQITIKSISPSKVLKDNVIQIKGTFTDDEGDIDSALIIYKWYDGATPIDITDTLRIGFDVLKIPAKTRDGDFTILFGYGSFNTGFIPLTPSPSIRDTTANFAILFKDKAKHVSPVKETDKIRLTKQ